MAKATKSKSKAVAVRAQAALPAFLADYKGPKGTEDIQNEDINIPRLKIGQAMTPEVKDGEIAEGELFLNVTGEVVFKPGDDPLPAIIVARSKEYILWRPRQDNGGGILARAKAVKDAKTGMTRYQWDKPNQSFDVKIEGKIKATWKTKRFIDEDGLGDWGSEIPGNKDSGIAATAHHNYVVVLPTKDNIICAISMSKSQVKKAKDLNAAIKMGDVRYPLFARFFKIVTIDDSNSKGDNYKNWSVKPDGYLGADDAELGAFAKQVFEGFQQTGYSVDMSDGGDEVADEPANGGKSKGRV